MTKEEIFQILGIQETTDEKIIKNAYREKLSVTNPEDNPEGFKRLRSAYEEACSLAARGPVETIEDTTPSGLWMKEVSEVYRHMSRRIDTDCWNKLFTEDVFLSLEEEENCTQKLLVFLTEHFRLPSDVWTLLEKQLKITEKTKQLKEHFPADFVSYLLSRIEEGDDFEYELFTGEDDASYDLYLRYYESCWRSLDQEEYVQAKDFYEKALELNIQHPAMEICHARLLVSQNDIEGAMAGLEQVLQKYPDNVTLLFNTAEILWQAGEDYHETAATYFERLKKLKDKHYMSNLRLTQWYYECHRYQEAKKCAEKVLGFGASDEFIELLRKVNVELEKNLEKEWYLENRWEAGLDLSWCYLQDGRLTEGLLIAKALEKCISSEKEAEWLGLIAKYSLERADYEVSLEYSAKWEEALKRKVEAEEDGEEKIRDIDRIKQSHMIRIQCYHNMGFEKESYFTDAIREAESILEGKSTDIQILMEMSQIYIEMGEYEKCDEIVDRLVEEYQVYAALVSRLEVRRRQLDAGGVVRTGSLCLRYFPEYVKAYEYIAKVYLDLERPEDMQKLLKTAEENDIHSALLDAYVYLMNHEMYSSEKLNEEIKKFREDFQSVQDGDAKAYEDGLKVITDILNHCPEGYLFVERAIFHRSAHHYDEAEEDALKALQLNPANPYALNAMSFLMKYRHQYDEAMKYLKKAILYGRDEMAPIIYINLADLCSLTGDYDGALKACKKYREKANKSEKWYLNKLAEVYVNKGNSRNACKLYETYAEKDPLESFNNCVEACIKCKNQTATVHYLTRWRQKIGLKSSGKNSVKSSVKELLGKYIDEKEKVDAKEAAQYYIQAIFADLVFENGRNTNQLLKELFSYESIEKASVSILADSIFACIVINHQKLGKKLALKLKQLIQQEKLKHTYFNREKGMLQLEILADWFENTEEELCKQLKQEEQIEICHFCTSCVCREVESLKILYLIRIGKKEEAKEKLEECLRKQPSDEYMLSIRSLLC